MKKIILLLLILFNLFITQAQDKEYVITIDGYVGHGEATCQSHGLQYIKLKFESGQEVFVFGSSVGQAFSDRSFESTPYAFNENKKLKGIEFHNLRRTSGSNGCRANATEQWQTITVDVESCYNKRFEREEVFSNQSRGEVGYAKVNIIAKPAIRFEDKNTPITSIETGCTTTGINLVATPGYANPVSTYKWQFLDWVYPGPEEEHPDWTFLKSEVDRAQDALDKCISINQELSECMPQLTTLNNAKAAKNAYTGPERWNPPIWRDIPGKNGQQAITLKPSDLFSKVADQQTIVGKNIQIRINPKCDDTKRLTEYNEDFVNILSVQFLPPPPNLTRVPEITQPKCADQSVEMTMYFDRNLKPDEDIYINLLQLRNGEYQSVENNILKAKDNPLQLVNGEWQYTFNRNNQTLNGGTYRIEISGYNSNTGILSCMVPPDPENFPVVVPDPVGFEAVKGNDQLCFESNDGSINITQVSGGTGPYFYSLDNGTNYSTNSFTSSELPIKIEGLAPAIYKVRVKDSNDCTGREDNGVQIKAVSIDIEKISNPIAHNEGEVTPPGAQGANDTKIKINTVTGGTAFTQNTLVPYYKYEILLDGDTNNSTGIKSDLAYNDGFLITELPHGTHTIRYHDANGCEQDIVLPTISNPEPITFTIKKKDPSCSEASDGELSVEDIKGGYPPYNISWTKDGNPYATGVSITGKQANYGVVVIDNRSGETKQEDIRFDNVPLPVEIDNVAETTKIKCFGEKATIQVTAKGGASGNYQYAILNGINDLQWQDSNTFNVLANPITGYQFVVRDANNSDCESPASDRVPIEQPDEISAFSIDRTDNTIFGGSAGEIKLDIIGGVPRNTSPEYTVSWTHDGISIANTGTTISGLKAGDYVATITDDTSCSVTLDAIEIRQPDKLEVTISEFSEILCNLGSGTLEASAIGGSESYSYTWYKDGTQLNGETSNILPDVSIGNYKVVVKDGYTDAEDSHEFEQPDPVSLSLDKNDASCFGIADGQIILSPVGGTKPYFFSIDDKNSYTNENDLTDLKFEGLSAGSYKVWLKDANGCEIDKAIDIIIGQPLEIKIEELLNQPVTTLGGNNGSIAIGVTNGVGMLSYSWTRENDPTFGSSDQNIQDVVAGKYTVTVTDEKGCTSTAKFEVREPLAMKVEIEETIPVLCYNDELGELLATVTGGFPIDSNPSDFEYKWYNVDGAVVTQINTDLTLDKLSDIGSGVYKVVVRDVEGTEAETTFDLKQPEELKVELDGDPIHVNCNGASTGAINISASGGPVDPDTGEYLPYTFRWTKAEDSDFADSSEDLENITAGTYDLVVIDNNLCTASLLSIPVEEPDTPLEVVNLVPINLSGFNTGNGSITLEINGGTKPYSFQWTNKKDDSYNAITQNIKNLSTGIYVLEVTDAKNCVLTLEREITEPNQLIVEIVHLTEDDGVQCNGKETLIPLSTATIGGIGEYSYEWYEEKNPSVILFTESQTETVNAGIYTVVVTDENGNKTSDTYTVDEPDPLSISENITDVLCNNGTDGAIDITVKGGVLPYLFRWSNGEITEDINGHRAGDYTIEVTDANHCSFSKKITIKEPNTLFVSFDRRYPSSNTILDGRIIADVRGGTQPYQYEWFDARGNLLSVTTDRLENIGPEKYALTITDANNCKLIIDDVDLFVPPTLTVVVEEQNVISCNGDTTSGSITAVVDGGVPFSASLQYGYQWYNADNDVVGSNNQVLSRIEAGGYYAKITDAVGSTVQSDVFFIRDPDPIELTFTADYINCGDQNDWTVVAQVKGGTAPYSYRWSDGSISNQIENVQPGGVYSVSVFDSRGCTAVNEIKIDPPKALSLTYSTTVPTCYEGCNAAITLDITGGAPPYSYKWNTNSNDKNLTNICAGDYEVIVTDAKGCKISQLINIKNTERVKIDLGEDITLCKDQSTILDATLSGTNITYQWTSTNGFNSTNPVIEVSESGIYEVKVTSSDGCTALDSIFVDTTDNVISADFVASTQVFVGEQFVVVNISDPIPDNVVWTFPEEAQIEYEDNHYAEMSIADPGEYEITLDIDRGLCSDIKTKRIIVVEREFEEDDTNNDISGSEITAKFDYKIYPNPTRTGKFSVDVKLPEILPVSVKIFSVVNNNQVGATHKEEGKDRYVFDYDLSQLTSGIYFILLETSKGNQVRKLIIE